METRASNVVVGALTLLVLLGGLGVVVWISEFTGQTGMVSHFARFLESVSGVNVGTPVLFGGIPIGHVTAVAIDSQDPAMARIDMTVRSDAPIRSDSVATLELKGLTGGVLVGISRGSAEGTLVKPGSEIPARYTGLQRILNGLPGLVSKGSTLLDNAEAFLSSENIATVDRVLANVQQFAALAEVNSNRINGTLDQITAAGKQVALANADFRKLGEDFGAIRDKLTGQVDVASRDIEVLKSALGTIVDGINVLIDDNRQPIHDFNATGVYEFPAMLQDVQLAVRTIKRISAAIARNPTQYLLQDRQAGFQAQGATRPER
jgi:phospholipid/cholesterol/gamma-HCH transport system substrate-binding protein